MVHYFGFKNKMWADNYATLIVGRKRQGKSTILAMIAQRAIAAGYTVFSNYPIDGALAMPKRRLKDGKTVLNKDFLYDNPALKDAYVLLDEVANIWNARSWGKWTDEDSDFFNFLGKNNTRVFMAIQYYDMLDLNVKRNLDATWYVRQSWYPHTCIVECEIQDVVKVANTQKRVIDSRFMQVSYEPCVIPDGAYRFRRKPWYPYFLTLYRDDVPPKSYITPPWHDIAFKPSLSDGQKPETEPLDSVSGDTVGPDVPDHP